MLHPMDYYKFSPGRSGQSVVRRAEQYQNNSGSANKNQSWVTGRSVGRSPADKPPTNANK